MPQLKASLKESRESILLMALHNLGKSGQVTQSKGFGPWYVRFKGFGKTDLSAQKLPLLGETPDCRGLHTAPQSYQRWTPESIESPIRAADHKMKKAGSPQMGWKLAFFIATRRTRATVPAMKHYAQGELPEPMLEHRIRLRAYELYLQGGRRSGHALDDWLEAEREVLRELQPRGFTPSSTRDRD
jgi:hypothetical protein